ncbi:hypothetical protein QZH41_009524, partial [Actinostola sp. cb2023]
MAVDDCVQVTVVDTFIAEDTLGGLVFLAFLLALILGLIIGALIMRYIFREIEDHNTRRKNKSFSSPTIETNQEDEPSTMKKMGSNRIFPLATNETNGKSVTIEMDCTHSFASHRSLTTSFTQTSKSYCFADALIKETGEDMDVELQTQDFRLIQKMEQDLRKEKSEIIEDIETDSRKEQDNEEQELRETTTDITELDNRLEQLHSKHSKKKDLRLNQLQEEFGRDLTKESELTEEEAEQILSKLMTNFTAAERRRAEEVTRQSMILHERLAKRQYMAQKKAAEKQEETEEYQERKQQPNSVIAVLKKRGKLMEDQSEKILEEYQQDLKVIEEKQQQAVLKHEAELAARLKKKREQKTKRLLSELEGQKEEFDSKANLMIAEGSMTAEDYLEAYHQLKVEQQAALEEDEETSDNYEAQEFQDLSQQLNERWKRSVSKREDELFIEIRKQAHLSEKESERLMKKHQEQLDEYSNKQQRERKRQQAAIKDKLKERKNRWEREAEQRVIEQDQMMTEQEQTLKQVLNAQIGLNEQLRKQVMLEHEQNLMALNNHLQISRIRQQKKVEQRLAQRRARLAELRKNMEEERSRKANGDPDQMKTLARSQNIEYQAEVKKMEEEHQAALEDLRRRLAAETEEALRDQDDRLGKILGKLQLEVTRRDEIIKNRDTAIRDLEKKLVDTMTKEGTMADLQTDKIMKQHQKQVDRLNQNIEQAIEAKRVQEVEEVKVKGVNIERLK